jgi:pantoate--beta-alanine ligase
VKLVRGRLEFLNARAGLPSFTGLVPTMGALHAGHIELLEAARRESATVIATIFVNPLQFGPAEDLDRYPRTLDADLQKCEAAGVDLVWAPSPEDVYRHGAAQSTVQPGPLGDILEGAVRPGHVAGVLTVVAKLFNIVRPDVAYFGEKDYQQLTLIRQMADDLDLGVEVVGLPTVREPDGLALSSRNVYLSADERRQALALSRALFAGQAHAAQGASAVVAAAREVLAAEPGLEVDYLELRDEHLGDIVLEPVTARLLVAARVGRTRLIDNIGVEL